jgi:hypothetical protein
MQAKICANPYEPLASNTEAICAIGSHVGHHHLLLLAALR